MGFALADHFPRAGTTARWIWPARSRRARRRGGTCSGGWWRRPTCGGEPARCGPEDARLDYDALTAVRPDVILTSVSAFGAGGPSSHRPGFDGTGQAMSGVMYLSGRPGEPTKAYCPYVDFTTALAAAVGTLAALLARRDTGRPPRTGPHAVGAAT